MPRPMVRTQIALTIGQWLWLRQQAFDRQQSQGEIIRDLIQAQIAAEPAATEENDGNH